MPSLPPQAAPSRRPATPPALPAELSLPLAAQALQAQATQAAALMKVLCNPDRLLLLCQLVQGERTVAELGSASGIAQPTLSQQLAVLRTHGLVATRREGKFVHYRVASAPVLALLTTLHDNFCKENAA